MTIDEIIAHAEDGGRFTVAGGSSIAYYFATVETVPDEDTEWTGEEVPTGNVIMVMVGDDRDHSIDPEDVDPIADEDYCHECGQIGCTADGR